MTILLLASSNPGKLHEMQALLKGFPVELRTPSQIGLILQVDEPEPTYAQNAARKAQAYARASGLLTLADDSGLEVDLLGGLPGIRSARYTQQPGATDADRRAYLLTQLKDHPRPWMAHFHCSVALASASGELRFAGGDCYGEIIPTERGDHGFGYDPIFLLPELGKTMAELSTAEKNRLSHRARAVHSALPLLTEMISASG